MVLGKLFRLGITTRIKPCTLDLELVARARELRATGLSNQAVADIIGRDREWVRRHAPPDGSTPRQRRSSPRAAPAVAKPAAPCADIIEAAQPEPIITVGAFDAIPGSSPIGIMELTATTCRWPISDPREPGFGYCGRSSSPYGYCTHHHWLGHRQAAA
jgi:hypothetical protein